MLIDFSQGRLVIDPHQYQTTLAVLIDSDQGRKECGVFAGRHNGFHSSEEGKRQKRLTPTEDVGKGQNDVTLESVGIHLYAIDRPEVRVGENQQLRYNYLAVTWKNSIYTSYPVTHELTLCESWGDEKVEWDVYVDGITIILDDYIPGYRTRMAKENT
jgi:hypothetical protein